MNIDPLAEKYLSISTYAYCANNVVNDVDPNGKDIVYINASGTESHRIKDDKVHSTYIMGNVNASQDPSKSTQGWVQVAMPNIIQERTQSGEVTTGSEYQENDYLIAARTGYFNQAKNTGQLELFTEGGNAIPQDAVNQIPDLDPTLVKAMTIQESHGGTTGISDVMQTNVAGDWSAMKSKYSLTKGETPSVTNSLFAGIRILATKGFKGGITYDKKTGKSTYSFQSWDSATKNYNGGGTANYQENVSTMVDESKKPTASDY